MVGQIVADMFMQVFIERDRTLPNDNGYSLLILMGGALS
jgi:hypothetical protein